MSERSMEKTMRIFPTRVAPEVVSRMRKMRAGGYLCRDIAHEFGVTEDYVIRYTRDVPVRRSTKGTGCNPRDEEREARIVAAARRGGLAPVAKEFGISRERVRQIVADYQRRTGDIVRAPRSRRAAKRPRAAPSLAQILLCHARLNRETGCWRWIGALHQTARSVAKPTSQTARRYGLSQIVYRATFHLWRGPLGREHIVPAVCGDKLCINPYHWQREVEVVGGED
jgi:transposase